ncbi:MAG: hypothetical protein WBB29_04245 [Geitlerinemataceae cyanobacterium]
MTVSRRDGNGEDPENPVDRLKGCKASFNYAKIQKAKRHRDPSEFVFSALAFQAKSVMRGSNS